MTARARCTGRPLAHLQARGAPMAHDVACMLCEAGKAWGWEAAVRLGCSLIAGVLDASAGDNARPGRGWGGSGKGGPQMPAEPHPSPPMLTSPWRMHCLPTLRAIAPSEQQSWAPDHLAHLLVPACCSRSPPQRRLSSTAAAAPRSHGSTDASCRRRPARRRQWRQWRQAGGGGSPAMPATTALRAAPQQQQQQHV